MGTIANQKNSGTVQLEFQAMGTSEASIMLQQPLLGSKSEVYTVEVTQLMMSLGEERATDGKEPLFHIVTRPDHGDYAPNLPFHIDMENYDRHVKTGMDLVDAWVEVAEDLNIAIGGYDRTDANPKTIAGIRSYSATDFVYQLSEAFKVLDMGIEFGITGSGQMKLKGTHAFWNGYVILPGRLMKVISGFGSAILITGGIYPSNQNGKFKLAAATAAATQAMYSEQDDLVWEVLDRRKMIRVDLSVPIGLSMGWDGNNERTIYSLQDFDIPKGVPTTTYEYSADFDRFLYISERQLVSTTEITDFGGKMAVKKLFPGPIQALRLSLILVYDVYDFDKETWVEKEKPVDMAPGDLFYLRIKFNKDAT